MEDRRENTETRRIVDVLTTKIEQILKEQRAKARVTMHIFATVLLIAVGLAATLAGIIYQTNERSFFGSVNNALLCALAKAHGIETTEPSVCDQFASWVRFQTNAAEVKRELENK
jgi:hypothetical protein